jgi:hypothetical protein
MSDTPLDIRRLYETVLREEREEIFEHNPPRAKINGLLNFIISRNSRYFDENSTVRTEKPCYLCGLKNHANEYCRNFCSNCFCIHIDEKCRKDKFDVVWTRVKACLECPPRHTVTKPIRQLIAKPTVEKPSDQFIGKQPSGQFVEHQSYAQKTAPPPAPAPAIEEKKDDSDDEIIKSWKSIMQLEAEVKAAESQLAHTIVVHQNAQKTVAEAAAAMEILQESILAGKSKIDEQRAEISERVKPKKE